ncbi:MAG: inositol monophosphatase family protein [Thermodesulfovibrionales bacterium]
MQIKDLQNIGSRLYQEMSRIAQSDEIRVSSGIGAGGDMTFGIDRIAEEIIIGGLKDLNIPLTIISEEAGVVALHSGGPKVIIDPVDGSKNAISGIPFYCTSIAVSDGETLGDLRLAYILNLLTGDEFSAVKGKGAFLNGRQIFTQKGGELSLTAYEAQAPGHDIPAALPLLGRSRKTRCFGSTALDLAHLAAGAVSLFICPSPSRSFDFAGGWLLVREAGGVMTDTKGRSIEGVALGLERSVALLAAGNQELHDRALKLLWPE